MKKSLALIIVLIVCSCTQEQDEVLEIIHAESSQLSYKVHSLDKALFSQDTTKSEYEVQLIKNNQDTVYGYDFKIIDGENIILNHNSQLYIFNSRNLSYKVFENEISTLHKLILPNHNLRESDLKDSVNVITQNTSSGFIIEKKYQNTDQFKNLSETYELSNQEKQITKIQTSLKFQGSPQYGEVNYSDFNRSVNIDLKAELERLKATFEPFSENSSYENPGLTNFMDIAATELQSMNKVRLENYNEKITILDFWYRACFPCLKSIPVLNEVYSKYKDQGVIIVGINTIDKLEKHTIDLQNFAADKKIEYPLLFSDTNDYAIKEYPTLIIFDAQNKVIYSKVGYQESFKDELVQVIENQLNL